MSEDEFQTAQDEEMRSTAKEIMRTKAVTPEQMASVLAWSLLNTLTLKTSVIKIRESLWSEDTIASKVEECVSKHCSNCPAMSANASRNDSDDAEEEAPKTALGFAGTLLTMSKARLTLLTFLTMATALLISQLGRDIVTNLISIFNK